MIDATTLRTLSRPRLAPFLAWVAIDWICIASAMLFAHASGHPVAYVTAALVVGNRQHALAIMGHDVAHRRASLRRELNDGLGALLTFWPLGIALAPYRRFHFAHHRHVGTPRDPELGHKAASADEFALPLPRGRLALQVLGDLALGRSIVHLVHLVRLTAPRSLREAGGPVAVALGGIGLLALADAWWVLGVWFGGMLTSFWACFRLRIWIEHIGSTDTHRVAVPAWARVLFAPHNAWAHYEHHRWPSIPQHRLPASRDLEPDPPVLELGALLDRYRRSGPLPGGALPGSPRVGAEVGRQASMAGTSSVMPTAISSS